MRVVRATDRKVLVKNCRKAESFWQRLRGWIGKRSAGPDEGLWFPRCSSVHMWWMSMPIDVVFLATVAPERFRVTSVHSRVPAWKIVPLLDTHANDALELAAGTIEILQIQVGEEVLCSN